LDWLTQYAWIGMLLFSRLGAVLMVAPVWGEQAMPPMMRLGMALLVTATLAPALAGSAPQPPADIIMAIPLIIFEIVIGRRRSSPASSR
jgi:flagellar biosynthetic protein FliR